MVIEKYLNSHILLSPAAKRRLRRKRATQRHKMEHAADAGVADARRTPAGCDEPDHSHTLSTQVGVDRGSGEVRAVIREARQAKKLSKKDIKCTPTVLAATRIENTARTTTEQATSVTTATNSTSTKIEIKQTAATVTSATPTHSLSPAKLYADCPTAVLAASPAAPASISRKVDTRDSFGAAPATPQRTAQVGADRGVGVGRAVRREAHQAKKLATKDNKCTPTVLAATRIEDTTKLNADCPPAVLAASNAAPMSISRMANARDSVETTSATPQHTEGGETCDTKSKAQLRAERRALQEAQRAAKQAKPDKSARPGAAPAKPAAAPPKSASTKRLPDKPAQEESARAGTGAAAASEHRVSWFQHLHTHTRASQHTRINCRELHPAVVRLVTQLASRVVCGANARCVALLHAVKQVVSDYSLPARTEFSRGLQAALATSLEAVWRARVPTPSMINAVKYLQSQLTQLPNNISEFDAKCWMKQAIDTYIREQVQTAADAISLAVRAKILHGDRILTYGCSSLVLQILREAWQAGLRFRAVVVGSRAHPHGREMLRRLRAVGVPAAYADMCALSFLMRTTDKVVVGASSVLANGWVVARAGTAQVAVAARAHNVPVLVCCETHKFSARVQTDAFVHNELGAAPAPLPALTALDLTYDVTSPDLVAAVVTELAVLPCTSAPVVLRFKLNDYAL